MRRLLVCRVGLIFFAAASAVAAEPSRSLYLLEQGGDSKVCQAYLAAITNYKKTGPNKCLFPENSGEGITVPARHAVNEFPDMLLVYDAVDDFLWRRDANPVWYQATDKYSTWTGSKKQLQSARKTYKYSRRAARMAGNELVKIDIDNDGIEDVIYNDRICGGAMGNTLLVLDTSGHGNLDEARSQLTLVHPPKINDYKQPFAQNRKGKELSPAPDALHNAFYDVFAFEGKTYFDFWWNGNPISDAPFLDGKLHVFLIQDHRRTEVCRYSIAK